jgi:hypothetical protein
VHFHLFLINSLLYDKAFLNEHPANESAENRKLEDFTFDDIPISARVEPKGENADDNFGKLKRRRQLCIVRRK